VMDDFCGWYMSYLRDSFWVLSRISPKCGIYRGMENILKQLLLHKSVPIPDTPTWHKDLLNSAVEHNCITKETANKIGKYLFFRHFFTHAYGFLLDEEKLKPLMENIPSVYSEFKGEIDTYLKKIEE
jgi:hypothetical protein